MTHSSHINPSRARCVEQRKAQTARRGIDAKTAENLGHFLSSAKRPYRKVTAP